MNNYITDTVVMVSPDSFGYNPQTAGTNVFQHTELSLGLTPGTVRDKAFREYSFVKDILKANAIRVLELSSPDGHCPDAIFPNNWFSHHEDGTLISYPMLTQNRRKERQPGKLITLLQKSDIPVKDVMDISSWEKKGWILEGTGSITLDRVNKIAFAMESPRTTKEAFFEWCRSNLYEPVLFHGYDNHHIPIYHTNILLNVGIDVAVLCPEAIPNRNERHHVLRALQVAQKELIIITPEQMLSFCGNIIQLGNLHGEKRIVLSTTAFNSFTHIQKKVLEKHGKLIPVDIPTIESIGGGSSRCMLAEVFH